MTYLSVCSGIEAASVAWEPLGWRPVAFSEIDRFPSAVLAHHYPGVPNLGDMRRFKEWSVDSIDLLVGGTPCQSFSVAGLRRGLDDPRGNLMLVYLALLAAHRPRWMVWENVPGVLSVHGGRAFGSLLGGLAQLGYGWAYRVLDAQYLGVPQRRRRVFVVGYLGDWRHPAAVLFERHSLSGNPPPRREAGARVALPVTSRVDRGGEHRESHGNNLVAAPVVANGDAHSGFRDERGLVTQALTGRLGGGGPDDNKAQGGFYVADISRTLNSGAQGRIDLDTETFVAHALRADGFDASEDGTGRGTPLVANTLTSQKGRGRANNAEGNYLPTCSSVRRLTPRECERLQGFPDDYTAITYRRKPAADGPRYRALGNSMAVPVMRWIGRRIAALEALS